MFDADEILQLREDLELARAAAKHCASECLKLEIENAALTEILAAAWKVTMVKTTASEKQTDLGVAVHDLCCVIHEATSKMGNELVAQAKR